MLINIEGSLMTRSAHPCHSENRADARSTRPAKRLGAADPNGSPGNGTTSRSARGGKPISYSETYAGFLPARPLVANSSSKLHRPHRARLQKHQAARNLRKESGAQSRTWAVRADRARDGGELRKVRCTRPIARC